MEWQQILGFYHVARLQSFTKAGEATFRTQSALSQQIKALEMELEAPLIERIGKGRLKLTSAGESFLAFAEMVLNHYDCFKEELLELKGARKGRLTVAAPYTTLYHLFPDKIREFATRFPQVELTLLDRPQDKVIQLVRNGDVDIGLALESSIQEDLMTIRWKKVETVLMVPRGHPLTTKKRITMKQIAPYPLILPPRDRRYQGRTALESYFQKSGLNYRVVMESSNVELTSVYVEMGLGISLATVVTDLPALKQRMLDFLPLSHHFPSDHLALIIRKKASVASCRSTFVNALLEGDRPPPYSSPA
ncbi:MAG TPA: LysR family transcriptional regulator [Syntrophobacteraceae bacterium]|nr:LysR family transcriptional regulator [Syntrophobacteraceae bacterium]